LNDSTLRESTSVMKRSPLFEDVSNLWICYPLVVREPSTRVREAMIIQVLHCPYCQGTDIVKHGLSSEGKQRYRCRACLEGRGRTFLLEYTYVGQSPEVKQQIVDMAMNASGIRDTARVLHVSPTTVINELKKRHLTSSK
jgi:transposase-like protein